MLPVRAVPSRSRRGTGGPARASRQWPQDCATLWKFFSNGKSPPPVAPPSFWAPDLDEHFAGPARSAGSRRKKSTLAPAPAVPARPPSWWCERQRLTATRRHVAAGRNGQRPAEWCRAVARTWDRDRRGCFREQPAVPAAGPNPILRTAGHGADHQPRFLRRDSPHSPVRAAESLPRPDRSDPDPEDGQERGPALQQVSHCRLGERLTPPPRQAARRTQAIVVGSTVHLLIRRGLAATLGRARSGCRAVAGPRNPRGSPAIPSPACTHRQVLHPVGPQCSPPLSPGRSTHRPGLSRALPPAGWCCRVSVRSVRYRAAYRGGRHQVVRPCSRDHVCRWRRRPPPRQGLCQALVTTRLEILPSPIIWV